MLKFHFFDSFLNSTVNTVLFHSVNLTTKVAFPVSNSAVMPDHFPLTFNSLCSLKYQPEITKCSYSSQSIKDSFTVYAPICATFVSRKDGRVAFLSFSDSKVLALITYDPFSVT